MQRLKHIHRALETRLDALHTVSRELDAAVRLVDLDDDNSDRRRPGGPEAQSPRTPRAPSSPSAPRAQPRRVDRDDDGPNYEMVERGESSRSGAPRGDSRPGEDYRGEPVRLGPGDETKALVARDRDEATLS